MTIFQQITVLIILYICVYALISRICKCIEHCATARAYSKFRENGVIVKADDVASGITKSKGEN